MDQNNHKHPHNEPELDALQPSIMPLEIVEHDDDEFDQLIPNEPKSTAPSGGFPTARHRETGEIKPPSPRIKKIELKIAMVPESQINSENTGNQVLESLDLSEVAKLQWTNPISNEEEELCNENLPKSASEWRIEMLRFDFDGRICTKLVQNQNDNDLSDYEDPLYYYKGLHHHGDQPHLPGYTLTELFYLAQSTSESQRLLSLRVIAEILAHSRQGVPFFIPLFNKLIEENPSEQNINPLPSSAFGFGSNRFFNYIICDLNITPLLLTTLFDSNLAVQTASLHIFSNILFLPASTYNIDKVEQSICSPIHNTKPSPKFMPNSSPDSHHSCIELFNMILGQGQSSQVMNRTWDAARKYYFLSGNEDMSKFFCTAVSENLELTFFPEFTLNSAFNCLKQIPNDQISAIYANEALIAHNLLGSYCFEEGIEYLFCKNFMEERLNCYHKKLAKILQDGEVGASLSADEITYYLVFSQRIIERLISSHSEQTEDLKPHIYFLRVLIGLTLQSSPIANYLSNCDELETYLSGLISFSKTDNLSLCLNFHILTYFYAIRMTLLKSVPERWLTYENKHAVPLCWYSIMLTLNNPPFKNIFNKQNEKTLLNNSWKRSCTLQGFKFLSLAVHLGLKHDSSISDVMTTLEAYCSQLKNTLLKISEDKSETSQDLLAELLNTDGVVLNQILFCASESICVIKVNPLQFSTIHRHALFICEYLLQNSHDAGKLSSSAIVSQLYISALSFMTNCNNSLLEKLTEIRDEPPEAAISFILHPFYSLIPNQISDTLSRWCWNTHNVIRLIEIYGNLLDNTIKNVSYYLMNCEATYVVHYCTEMGWFNNSSHVPVFYNDPSFDMKSIPFKWMILNCGFALQLFDYFSSLVKIAKIFSEVSTMIDIEKMKDQCTKLLKSLNDYVNKLYLEVRASSYRRTQSSNNTPVQAIPPFEVFAKLILACVNFLQLTEESTGKQKDLILVSCISSLACTCSTSTIFQIFDIIYNNLTLLSRRSNWKRKENWVNLSAIVCSIAHGNPLSITFLHNQNSKKKLDLSLSMNALDAWLLVFPQHSIHWGNGLTKNVMSLSKDKRSVQNIFVQVFCLSVDILVSTPAVSKFLKSIYSKQLIFKSMSAIFTAQHGKLAIGSNLTITNLHTDVMVQKQLKLFIEHFLNNPISEALRLGPFTNTMFSKQYLDLFNDILTISFIVDNFHKSGTYQFPKLVNLAKWIMNYKPHIKSMKFPTTPPKLEIFDTLFSPMDSIQTSIFYNYCLRLKENIDQGIHDEINSASLLMFYTSSIFPDHFRQEIWKEPSTMRILSKQIKLINLRQEIQKESFPKNTQSSSPFDESEEFKTVKFTGLIGPIQIYIAYPTDNVELLEKYRNFLKKHISDRDFEDISLAIFIALHQLICYSSKIQIKLSEYIGICKSIKIQRIIVLLETLLPYDTSTNDTKN